MLNGLKEEHNIPPLTQVKVYFTPVWWNFHNKNSHKTRFCKQGKEKNNLAPT